MRRIFIALLVILLTACSTAAPAVPTSTAAPSATAAALPQATATPAQDKPQPTATLPAATATALPQPSATPAATSTPDAALALQAEQLKNTAWAWTASGLSGADALRYAVTFLPDGKLSVQADCAATTGTYQLNGAGLKFEASDPSQPACGPGSRQADFLKQLRATSAFQLKDGVLTLTSSTGAMQFNPSALLTPAQPAAGSPQVKTSAFAAVHAGPGNKYPIYAVLLPGLSAEAAGRNFDSGWWAIKLPNYPDGMGWVDPTLIQVSNPDKAVYIPIEQLHVKGALLWPDNKAPRASLITPTPILSGPGAAYPSVLMGLPGDTFYVLGRSADSQYLAVYLGAERIPGGIAWVQTSEADPHNIDNVSVYPAPPVPSGARFYQPGPGDPIASALTVVNLRTGPGHEYSVVGTLSRGEFALITGRSVDALWWQVRVSPSLSDDGFAWVAQSVVRTVNPEKVTNIISAFPFPYRRPDTISPACTVVDRSPRALTRFNQGVDFTLMFEIRNDTSETWSKGDVDFVYIDNMDNAMFHTGPNRIDITEAVIPGNTYILKMDARTPIKHEGLFGERWVVRKAGGTVCTFTFQLRLNK
jgi:heat shock protein HslJ/uncharacterized protein YraI